MSQWHTVPVAFGVLGLVAVGCGGSSEEDPFADDAAAVAGSGHVAAGTSGAAAGSGGRGGNPVGGANAGPSGGMSSGGTVSGGGAAAVPPELLDRCAALCATNAESGCANAPGQRECAQQCRVSLQKAECHDDFDLFFACAERVEVECDAEGDVTLPGCDNELALAGVCLLANVPAPELREPCEEYCANAAPAQCPNTETDLACVLGCQVSGSLYPSCSQPWSAFLSCAEGATFYCDDDGNALPEGCEAEYLLFAACIVQAIEPP